LQVATKRKILDTKPANKYSYRIIQKETKVENKSMKNEFIEF